MTSIELTAIQRAVLLGAAHSAGLVAWPLPARLKLNGGSGAIVARGLMKRGLVEERPALGTDPVWREAEDSKFTLIISKKGLSAVGMVPEQGQHAASPSEANAPIPSETTQKAPSPDQPRRPRAGTKLAILVELLERSEGATIEELASATGWKAHTVRGVMSGALAKKFEMSIASQRIAERGRVYRVVRSHEAAGRKVSAETD